MCNLLVITYHSNNSDYLIDRTKSIYSSSHGDNYYYCSYNPSKTPCIAKIPAQNASKDLQNVYNEIWILQILCGGPNIIQVYDVLRNIYHNDKVKLRANVTLHGNRHKVLALNPPVIIYEYINATPWKKLVKSLTEGETRYYMTLLLKALVYIHKKEVMHRDIQHNNVLIDTKSHTLRVIDFNTAAYHYTGASHQKLMTNISYRGVDVLVGHNMYTRRVDLWGLGCIMASIVLEKEVIFEGNNEAEVLESQAKVSIFVSKI